MPNTSGSAKKQNNEAAKSNASPKKSSQKSGNNNNNKARKRKLREVVQSSDETELESELEECDIKDALAIERKLRKVAEDHSLSNDDMKKLLQKFVKNDHVLALVTLKAEDELARERRESEQRAIIITDTPSVPKLTRAKARELNKTPAITLPALSEAPQPEIVALIKDDLHSDEEDEEYTFREEDFASDDDPNNTTSDFDSNPCTPQTPLTQTEYEESPVKLTADGCFKIPLDKQNNTTEENLRIAARTRSKLCLQQTTIEDIQSEFVPPDVDLNELHDIDATANDEDWMQFLNDFSKPLNNSILGDDDDPINDPEYVAADKVPMDAEELRNVNISRKELTELVAELFEGLVNEGISLESIDLETPQKFLQNSSTIENSNNNQLTPTTTANPSAGMERLTDVTRQIDFGDPNGQQQTCLSDATITSTNVTQQDCSFQPDVMSTPAINSNRSVDIGHTVVPIATNANSNSITIPATHKTPELIAIPVPGQPNHFNLARVVSNANQETNSNIINASMETIQNGQPNQETNSNITNASLETTQNEKEKKSKNPFSANVTVEPERYERPYDNNFTFRYISVRRHIFTEYLDKFENLRNLKNVSNNFIPDENTPTRGFTTYQHELLQQQLRIHVQMLTQTYIQIYCHPEYWKFGPDVRSLLNELQEKAKEHATFNAWNLNEAIELAERWEDELSSDTPENKALMAFIHKEIKFCGINTRQVTRFPPRIMELILNSKVFMYPNYLPRIPFSPKHFSFQTFAPSEYYLIALGLEKHLKRVKNMKKHASTVPYLKACKYIAKDTVFGKNQRRIADEIRRLMNADYYNPVKYFFEHNRAPPIEQHLITFENNTVKPPIERFDELPLAWRNYIEEKNKLAAASKQTNEEIEIPSPATSPNSPALNYLNIVREALGDNIQLPDSLIEAAEPAASATDFTSNYIPPKKRKKTEKKNNKSQPNSVIINVNYVFGAPPNQVDPHINQLLSTLPNATTVTVTPQRALPSNNISINNYESVNLGNASLSPTSPSLRTTTTTATTSNSNIIAYNYDYNLQQLEPVVAEITEITDEPLPVSETVDNITKQTTPIKRKSKEFQSHLFKTTLRAKRPPRNWRHSHNHNKRFGAARKRHYTALQHRHKNTLKKRCLQLLTSYRQFLEHEELIYKKSPLILRYYKYFKALDLYTDLLRDLKMFCRNAAQANNNTSNSGTIQSPSNSSNKRFKGDDDANTVGGNSTTRSSKKLNRQEENLRNMLLPDTAEDANRKDAIYAFNFHDKVEETFKADNRLADYEQFNFILNSFDAQCDRPSDLYLKLESLFLPDYPELAQLFLTFLLPAEAAEIGKFFEHYMAINGKTFITKLNDFFKNQPAQIRKIYSCLNELAHDNNVNLKKVEEKILPLLKGNQFLIDWFMQLFPEAPVPERLLPPPETVNLKEVQGKQSGESMETVKDILDSPTTDQQPQCQLRYINGRIFYGLKMTLPAKLSFLASKYANKDEQLSAATTEQAATIASNAGCIHGIREYGEKRLAAATANTNPQHLNNSDTTSDDANDKSEDELSKALVIDTTSSGNDEDSCSSVDICDDATLRAHALRLNPNVYSNTCFTSIAATSTPNIGNVQQLHHPNAKKQSLNFYDDFKLSPRKQITSSPIDNFAVASNTLQNVGTTPHNNLREKRKSPTKKIKSPNSSTTNININKSQSATATPIQQRTTNTTTNSQPMVIIPRNTHGAGAIAYAKKLKTLVESSDEQTNPETIQTQPTPIIASIKQRPFVDLTTRSKDDDSNSMQHNLVPKLENSDEMEFLPEHTPPREENYQNDFPRLQFEPDSSTEKSPNYIAPQSPKQQESRISTHLNHNIDSDEECKLDIVATLASATSSSSENIATNSATTTTATMTATTSMKNNQMIKNSPQTSTKSAPFTREEDKIFLIEMKLGSRVAGDLIQRISAKLPNRTQSEIISRHQFLIEFLSKLQGK